MTTVLILSGVILLLVAVIVCLFHSLSKKKKEIRQLAGEVRNLENSIRALSEYLKKISGIKNDGQDLAEKLAGAGSDEEVENILNDIISSNNDRVRDKQTD